MSNFKVGDIAVWQNQIGDWAHLNDKEVLITGDLSFNYLETVGPAMCYEVDLPNSQGRRMFALPTELRRRKPPQSDSMERMHMQLWRDLAGKAVQREGEAA
jgi:hypothetical protein